MDRLHPAAFVPDIRRDRVAPRRRQRYRAIVADGWACGFYGFDAKRAGAHYARDPELLAQLVITMEDGGEQRIVTDEHWRSSTGAIAHADLLMGERRDQRREPPSWTDRVSTTARGGPLRAVGGATPALVADPGPPIRVTEELPARTVLPAAGGGLIVDFGQNLAGWVRLKVDEPPGTVIRVRHGEVLDEEGSLYVDNLRTARQTDLFTTAAGLRC